MNDITTKQTKERVKYIEKVKSISDDLYLALSSLMDAGFSREESMKILLTIVPAGSFTISGLALRF